MTTAMKFQWTRNMAGQTLSDEEMSVIAYPLQELIVHVTTKTIQACAILGIVIGPVVRLARGPRTLGALSGAAVKAAKVGALIGVPMGPAMTYMRIQGAKVDDEGLYDRCYRLRYNRNQVRTDRFAYLGTIGGAAGALAMGGPLTTGVVMGLVSGTILGGVYNTATAEKKTSSATEEKKAS